LSQSSFTLEHLLCVNSFSIVNYFADVNSPKTRESLPWFRTDNKCMPSKFDLTGKALYLNNCLISNIQLKALESA
jgi:hypothetical protein